MALESEVIRKSYSANGSTGAFSFPYYFLDATDLDVYTIASDGTETTKSFVTDYDVIGNFNPLTGENDDFSSGASVSFTAAPASGLTVVIIRNNPDTQDTSLVQNSAYSSAVIETALDKIVMMIQFLFDRSSRSVRMTDPNNQTFDSRFPNPIVADSTIAINPAGTGIVMGPTVTNINAASTYATAAAASATAAAASATSASTSATNASTSATNASTSATNAAASATLAQNYIGAGAIGDTSFTIVNNQSSPANVTGLLFSGTTVRSAEIDVQFYRNTTSGGATELSSRAKYLATYKTVAASWDLAVMGVGGDVDATSGEPSGVTLSITSAGQVQYTSTSISGTAASSVMHFRANTMGV